MVVVYLSEYVRDMLLYYDIENSEDSHERTFYYIENTPNKILHDIIDGFIGWHEDELERLGFDLDLEPLRDGKFTVEFTDKDDCYIEV